MQLKLRGRGKPETKKRYTGSLKGKKFGKTDIENGPRKRDSKQQKKDREKGKNVASGR